MTTTASQLGPGSLRIGFGSGMSPRNKENWKSVLGHKPVAARLEVLGDSKSRWGSFGTGILLQIFGVALLVTVPMLFPQKLIPIMRYEIIALFAPLISLIQTVSGPVHFHK